MIFSFFRGESRIRLKEPLFLELSPPPPYEREVSVSVKYYQRYFSRILASLGEKA
jgi:hypothetical protein